MLTREQHKAHLVCLIETLHGLLSPRKPAYENDKIGVRGFKWQHKAPPTSFNDVKSNWAMQLDGAAVQFYFNDRMRPCWHVVNHEKVFLEFVPYVNKVGSIQYSKKTRQIWYNNWDSSCPRFSIEEIEAEL